MDFNPNRFSNHVDYNVIDNINPKYLQMKHWRELIGGQENWTSNCKDDKPVNIKGRESHQLYFATLVQTLVIEISLTRKKTSLF